MKKQIEKFKYSKNTKNPEKVGLDSSMDDIVDSDNTSIKDLSKDQSKKPIMSKYPVKPLQIPPLKQTRSKWTQQEEQNLARGVELYGVGNWSQILSHYKFNKKRNSVSLKDKWRNMVKHKSHNLKKRKLSLHTPKKKDK